MSAAAGAVTPAKTSRPRRPLMRYFGGKWRIAPWIVKHFPPHTCYVEPFAGAGSVLLRKEPSEYEYLNDADAEVVNLFDMLRTRHDEFIRAIELTPFSRLELRRSLEPTDDLLERARRLYIRAWQARGGPRAQWNTGWRFQVVKARGKRAADDWNDIGHLWGIVNRLKQVGIECDDYVPVLGRFDAPTTLFYVDPPYLGTTRSRRWLDKGYAHDFTTEDDHRALAGHLAALAGMVVLSGYPSDLYRELYCDQGWEMRSKRTKTDVGYAVEAIWINPSAIERGAVTQSMLWPTAAAAPGPQMEEDDAE